MLASTCLRACVHASWWRIPFWSIQRESLLGCALTHPIPFAFPETYTASLRNERQDVVMSRHTCRDCGEIMTTENRVMKSVSKKGKQYYLNRCKTCITESETILRKLKKENPQPPAGTPCECCGRIDKLFYDHDHSSKT